MPQSRRLGHERCQLRADHFDSDRKKPAHRHDPYPASIDRRLLRKETADPLRCELS